MKQTKPLLCLILNNFNLKFIFVLSELSTCFSRSFATP